MMGAGEGMRQGGGGGGGGGGSGALQGAGLAMGFGVIGQMMNQQQNASGVAPQANPPVQSQLGKTVCGACGSHVNPGKFCASCGKALSAAPATKFCASCGSKMPEGAKFCGDCGTAAG